MDDPQKLLKDVLTNFDLLEYGKDLRLRNYTVLMKDEFTLKRNWNYIINLHNKGQSGSHWVSMVTSDTAQAFYFDSFGMPPPQNIVKILKDNFYKIYFNSKQIQDIKSEVCGYFTLGFIIYMRLFSQPSISLMNNFAKFFKSKKLSDNDLIIKKFVRRFLINR